MAGLNQNRWPISARICNTFGGTEYSFHSIEKTFDASAQKLIDAFTQNFLIPFLKLAHGEKAPQKAIDSNIGSRYTLVYEILYRIVSAALSDDENSIRLTQPLLDTVSEFIKKLNEGDYLDNFDVKIKLLREYPNWIKLLSHGIKVCQLVKAPTRAFTRATDYFKSVIRTIKTQILAFLPDNSFLPHAAFTLGEIQEDQWLENTYNRKLKAICDIDSSSVISHTNKLDITLTIHQNNVIKKIHELNKNAQKIAELFLFLNKTNAYYEMFCKIDSLTRVSNWILFINGKIDVVMLVKCIEHHAQESEKLLDFSDIEFLRTASGEALIKTGRISATTLTEKIDEIYKDLILLGTESNHRLLGDFVCEQIEGLFAYQQALGIHFVTADPLQALPTSSESTFSLSNTSSSKLRAISATTEVNQEASAAAIAQPLISSQPSMPFYLPENNRTSNDALVFNPAPVRDETRGKGKVQAVFSLTNFLYYSIWTSKLHEGEELRRKAKEGCISRINFLLDSLGVNINTRGIPGTLCSTYQGLYDKTPLMIAAAEGQLETVKLLIERGANINECCDSWGFTALHHAAYKNQKDIITLLIKYKAKLDIKTLDNCTPLDIAIDSISIEAAFCLKSLEAPHSKNWDEFERAHRHKITLTA